MEQGRDLELEAKAYQRQMRKHRKALENLTERVLDYLVLLDNAMKFPESKERGRLIARLNNALEYANDQARYFTLGVDYRRDKARKQRHAAKVLATAAPELRQLGT